jgi:hypothetical protein
MGEFEETPQYKKVQVRKKMEYKKVQLRKTILLRRRRNYTRRCS